MKITIEIDERPTQELPAIDPEVPEHKRAPDIAALEGMNERQYQHINALQAELDKRAETIRVLQNQLDVSIAERDGAIARIIPYTNIKMAVAQAFSHTSTLWMHNRKDKDEAIEAFNEQVLRFLP